MPLRSVDAVLFAMAEQTSVEQLLSYQEGVLEGGMDEGRRTGMLCCSAAVQGHMPGMMRWRHLMTHPPCQVLTQVLTQPAAAVDSNSTGEMCM